MCAFTVCLCRVCACKELWSTERWKAETQREAGRDESENLLQWCTNIFLHYFPALSLLRSYSLCCVYHVSIFAYCMFKVSRCVSVVELFIPENAPHCKLRPSPIMLVLLVVQIKQFSYLRIWNVWIWNNKCVWFFDDSSLFRRRQLPHHPVRCFRS